MRISDWSSDVCSSDLTRIPTLRADVDAPAHREMVVEHRDLLMMAAPDGMCAVEPEADRARYLPAQQHRDDARHDELLQSAEIPVQDVDVAVGTILREPQHVMAERDRKSTRLNSSH